jgi:hypothetical protein
MTVYAIGEAGSFIENHLEWENNPEPEKLGELTYGAYIRTANNLHGTRVACLINGKDLGVCKKCRVVRTNYVQADTMTENGVEFDPEPRDWYLQDLLMAWDDMNKDGRTPDKCVVNMSWGSKYNYWTPEFIRRLYDILKRMDRAAINLGPPHSSCVRVMTVAIAMLLE